MSAGISLREFARRDGCSDKIVRRAISAGHLKTLADGTLDEALVGTGWRKGNRNADTRADTGADSADSPHELLEEQPHGGALKRRRRPEPDDEDLDDPLGDGFIARLLAGETLNLADAERVKANALALKQLVAARRDAGALVEIELAERVLFEAARQHRDAWLNWPSRVGPLVAADLDMPADRVVELLTTHVHAQLEELGDPEPDFAA